MSEVAAFNTCGRCGEKWQEAHLCREIAVDAVVNPAHYNTLSPEPWDVIIAWNLPYCLGNVVKYVARAGREKPDAATDLKKARAYLDREIARLMEIDKA